MEKNFDLYDKINTTAVQWLTYNAKAHNKPIGIKNFFKHNLYHMWLLHMMQNYSIFNGYVNYYIEGNFFTFLYLRYIRKFKNLRYRFNKDVLMIEVGLFVDELISCFDNVNPSIIEQMYKEYWGDDYV